MCEQGCEDTAAGAAAGGELTQDSPLKPHRPCCQQAGTNLFKNDLKIVPSGST